MAMFVIVLAGSRGQSVRLVSVPRFSQTRTLVLVNLSNLQCQPITFDADFSMICDDNQGSPDVDKWREKEGSSDMKTWSVYSTFADQLSFTYHLKYVLIKIHEKKIISKLG